MRAGEVVSNINVLNEAFQIDAIDELVQRKREGAEKKPVVASKIARHDRVLDQLEVMLTDAHERSALPEEPTTRQQLDDFVVRLRMEAHARES